MLRSLRISRLWKSPIEGSPLQCPSASPRPVSSLCKPYLLGSRFSLDLAGEAAVPGKFLKWASVGFCRGSKFATRFTPLQPKPLESIIDLERAKSCSPEHLVSVWDYGVRRAEGISIFSGEPFRWYMISNNPSKQINVHNGEHRVSPYLVRTFASNYSTQSSKGTPKEEMRKDISTVEDPFDAPTYNIPEKPVTFTEGASYSVIILAGLGVAALAAYAVFKELIFEPKEYKIFGKALERVKNDNQITVRIGSPVTGYGSESRNRAARQRIPHRVWTDEDGIEHVEVNFYIRGPHGSGKVYSEMFKDPADRTWKYTFLIVEITSPSRAQLMLESYVPA